MQAFSYKLYKGNLFKELVKTLLEDFGYVTAPYGYENQFSTMIKKELNANHSDTAKRIRSSPDLLVYDREKNQLNVSIDENLLMSCPCGFQNCENYTYSQSKPEMITNEQAKEIIKSTHSKYLFSHIMADGSFAVTV